MSSKDKKEKYATEKRIQQQRMDRKMKLKELEIKKGTYFDSIREQVIELYEEREFKEAMKTDKTPMLSPVFNQVKGVILRQRDNKTRLANTGQEKIDIGTPFLDVPLIDQEVQDSKAMDQLLDDNKNYLEVSRLCKEVSKLNIKRDTYKPKGDATGTCVEELFKQPGDNLVSNDQIQQHIFDKKESIKQRLLNSEKQFLKQAQQQALMQQKNIIMAQKNALIHQLSVKAYNDAQAPSTPNTSQIIRSDSLSPPAKKIQMIKLQQLQQSPERKLSLLIKSNNDSPGIYKDKLEAQDSNNINSINKGGFQQQQHLSNFSIRLETTEGGNTAQDHKNLSQGRNQEKIMFLFKESSLGDQNDNNEQQQYFQGNGNQRQKSNKTRSNNHHVGLSYTQRNHSEEDQLSSHLLFFASPVHNRVSAQKPKVLLEQYPKAKLIMHTDISNFSKVSQQNNVLLEKSTQGNTNYGNNNEITSSNLLNVSRNQNNNTNANQATRRQALEKIQMEQEKEEEKKRQLIRENRLHKVQKKLGLFGPSSSRKEQYNKFHKELSDLQSEIQEAQQQSQVNSQPKQFKRKIQTDKEIQPIINISQVLKNGLVNNNNNINSEKDHAGTFYSSRSSTQHQSNSSFMNQLFHNKHNQLQSKLSQQSSRLFQHSIHSAAKQVLNNNQSELYSGNSNNINNKLQTEPSGKKSTHSLHVISSNNILNPAQTYQTLSSSTLMHNQQESELAVNKLHRTQTFSDSITMKDFKTSHGSNQRQNQLSNIQIYQKQGQLKIQVPNINEQINSSQNIILNEQFIKSQLSSTDANQSQAFQLVRQNNSNRERYFDKNTQSDRLNIKQVSPQNKGISQTSSLSPNMRISRMNSELSSFIQKKQSGQDYFVKNTESNNSNNNIIEFGRKITEGDKVLQKQRVKMNSFFSQLLQYKDQAQAQSHTINKKLNKDFAAITGTLRNWNQIFTEANSDNKQLEKNSVLQSLLDYVGNEEN